MKYRLLLLPIVGFGIPLLLSCGSDQDDPNITPININFEASEASIYTGTHVTFHNNTTGASQWEWTFEGANPSTATNKSPTVFYDQEGTFDVTLGAINDQESKSEIKEDYIQVMLDNEPPGACLDILFEQDSVNFNCFPHIFTINVGCSSDNVTPFNDLQVRYDLFGDGNWDTDFSTEKTRSYFWGPKPPNPGVWHVIVEIKDEQGNSSTASMPMDTTAVASPDIWVGRLGITKDNDTDTFYDQVKVGESFLIQVSYGGTGDFSDLRNDMHLKVNGELTEEWASIGTPGCATHRRSYSYNTPGSYTVTIEMDVFDTFDEVNENNNFKSFTFEVVE